jgi:Uma2 family endonuclease
MLRPRADGYRQHPRAADVLLVIEVADTSLPYDRDVKIPLYARAGIPEVWVVDLEGARIEVYRTPGGDGHRDVSVVSRGAMLSPSAFPDVTVPVAEVLA